MQPKFYNSLSKHVEELTTKEPGKIRIYNCGPTVYKRQHIGNMRRYLFADFLRRSLEFLGYEVREVTNITDVGHLTQDEIDAGEDKLEKAARETKKTPQDIAQEQTKLFFEDLKTLNIQPAHLYPRASAHVAQMQKLIVQLIKNKHAYQTSTGVYFDVLSFPDYGKLSGNTLDKISAGARVEVRTEKKHPADFALWVVDPSHVQKWDSPWGIGYPGWHIECSAMSLEYLGDDIDIHTGGEDNRFPHHENEIAQSEGATGKNFVRVWMHNRHLMLAGIKMAKREGETITLDTIRAKGFSPLAFRLLVFGSHYRSPMEFSWEALEAAQKNLESMKGLVRRLLTQPHPDPLRGSERENLAKPGTSPYLRRGRLEGPGEVDVVVVEQFSTALSDDLKTPKALGVLMKHIHEINLDTLRKIDHVLGIIGPLEAEIAVETIPAEIQQLAQDRAAARQTKKFDLADEIRQKIELKGFALEDTPSGPRLIKL